MFSHILPMLLTDDRFTFGDFGVRFFCPQRTHSPVVFLAHTSQGSVFMVPFNLPFLKNFRIFFLCVLFPFRNMQRSPPPHHDCPMVMYAVGGGGTHTTSPAQGGGLGGFYPSACRRSTCRVEAEHALLGRCHSRGTCAKNMRITCDRGGEFCVATCVIVVVLEWPAVHTYSSGAVVMCGCWCFPSGFFFLFQKLRDAHNTSNMATQAREVLLDSALCVKRMIQTTSSGPGLELGGLWASVCSEMDEFVDNASLPYNADLREESKCYCVEKSSEVSQMCVLN